MVLPHDSLDDIAVAIYLEVPASKVVVFQAFFDIYEAIGFVRTIDLRRSMLAVVTTKDCLEDCCSLLEAIKGMVPWRIAQKPGDSEKIFGYALKERQLQDKL